MQTKVLRSTSANLHSWEATASELVMSPSQHIRWLNRVFCCTLHPKHPAIKLIIQLKGKWMLSKDFMQNTWLHHLLCKTEIRELLLLDLKVGSEFSCLGYLGLQMQGHAYLADLHKPAMNFESCCCGKLLASNVSGKGGKHILASFGEQPVCGPQLCG